MKAAIRILVTLCVLGAAAWGGLQLYHWYVLPGRAGHDMEVRLVARYGTAAPASGADASQTNPAASPAGSSPDVDLFQPQDASSYAASGNAPSGWKWLPVTKGVEKEFPGGGAANAQSGYVTRTSNGQVYLLVADGPDTALTHASQVKPWGVDSVKVINDEIGPAVDIRLDKEGGDLMHEFTEKYLGHTIAVVVSGQISEVAEIQSPVRSGLMVRLPAGRQSDAENLRDALMK